MSKQMRVTITSRQGARLFAGVFSPDTLEQDLLLVGWHMPRGFAQAVSTAKGAHQPETLFQTPTAAPGKWKGVSVLVRLAAIGMDASTRNHGTVASTLTRLAGSRKLPDRPENMRGEFTVDGRALHYWAAAPENKTYWCVDTETRKYVRVRDTAGILTLAYGPSGALVTA